MEENLTLDEVRARLTENAVCNPDLNDLQLAQITRFIHSQGLFEKYVALVLEDIPSSIIVKVLTDLSQAIAIKKEHLN